MTVSSRAVNPQNLKATVEAALGSMILSSEVALDELTVVVGAQDYFRVAEIFRDPPACRFEQMIDLCGVDYSTYKGEPQQGLRFCVVVHLLSVSLNQRVRLKVFAPDDDFPVVPSITSLWTSANWFEREAFDLFGIVFDGHDDAATKNAAAALAKNDSIAQAPVTTPHSHGRASWARAYV